jgi:hypothetical protein
MTLYGKVADINVALSQLSYFPNPGFNSLKSALSDQLKIIAWDQFISSNRSTSVSIYDDDLIFIPEKIPAESEGMIHIRCYDIMT